MKFFRGFVNPLKLQRNLFPHTCGNLGDVLSFHYFLQKDLESSYLRTLFSTFIKQLYSLSCLSHATRLWERHSNPWFTEENHKKLKNMTWVINGKLKCFAFRLCVFMQGVCLYTYMHVCLFTCLCLCEYLCVCRGRNSTNGMLNIKPAPWIRGFFPTLSFKECDHFFHPPLCFNS